jgi:voltage-gated potassium channel
MLLGYSIIVIPTGIVATSGRERAPADGPSCPDCGATGHQTDALFCRKCGTDLKNPPKGEG